MDQLSAVMRELKSQGLGNATGNSSSNSSSPMASLSPSLLPNILSIFIPGYATVSALGSDLLGFDVTLAVTLDLGILGIIKGGSYLMKKVQDFFFRWSTHSLTFDEHDWIFDWTLDMLQEASKPGSGRSEKVVWDWRFDQIVANMGDVELKDIIAREQRFGRPLKARYLPSMGHYYFFYNGRLFCLELSGDRWRSATLSCVWTSLAPLKKFINDVLLAHQKASSTKTRVLRPKPKGERSGTAFPWREVSKRPSRPLSTVILGKAEKERVLQDVFEYLQPQTSHWYEARGIPYRRGYVSRDS